MSAEGKIVRLSPPFAPGDSLYIGVEEGQDYVCYLLYVLDGELALREVRRDRNVLPEKEE